ncbi:hypothetical protein LVJ94_36325 [Pendulispora rubella]|uniref:Uncharacterized protein n=1 Tax=Pendulispora rubella TaxID=2741070 RepID=A0ABZ2KZG2_9BACT
MRRAYLGLFLPLLVGCGAGSQEAKSPSSSNGSPGNAGDVSIGDAAVRQGGMWSTEESAPPLASALEAFRVEKKIKLDGVLGEWPARAPATTAVQGSAGELTFQGAVQYDDQYVYVAGETNDAKFVAGKDHASLTIAIPGPGGIPSAHEIAFFPGKPGETAGRVLFAFGAKRGEVVPGAKVVEAPHAGGGYSFEAVVPWSTFPEARAVRVGLRGVLSYYDAGEKTATILATGPGDVEHVTALPSLPTEPEQALMAGLLKPRGLAARGPTIDVYADVFGDGQRERVSVFGHFLTIVGQGYRDGKEFFYRDLGSRTVVRVDARDVTGEGKDDLLVRSHFEQGGMTHDWFEVWQIAASGEPATLFGQEIELARGNAKIANSVHVHEREIEIAVDPAAGPGTSLIPTKPAEVEPILTPWGPVRSRTYRFDGSKFVAKNEVAQKAQTPPSAAAIAPPSPSVQAPAAQNARAAVPEKRDLLDLYRREHNVPADVAPTGQATVNLREGPVNVVLLGNDLVLYGAGFKGGAQYAYLSLPQFASPGSVKELAARDLNGDDVRDLIVRGIHIIAPRQGTTPEITSEAIFAYELRDGKFARLFAVETAREQGQNRVQSLFQFLPAKSGGKSIDIELRPGKATGWTEKSYPWPNEQPGPVELLVLPWSRTAARYGYNPTSQRFELLK